MEKTLKALQERVEKFRGSPASVTLAGDTLEVRGSWSTWTSPFTARTDTDACICIVRLERSPWTESTSLREVYGRLSAAGLSSLEYREMIEHVLGQEASNECA